MVTTYSHVLSTYWKEAEDEMRVHSCLSPIGSSLAVAPEIFTTAPGLRGPVAPSALFPGVASTSPPLSAMTVRPPRIRTDTIPESRLISRIPRVTGRCHVVLT